MYLRLTDDEIKELVAKYWFDFKIACNSSHDDSVNRTLNSALKLICDQATVDEWISLLTEVEKVSIIHSKENAHIISGIFFLSISY